LEPRAGFEVLNRGIRVSPFHYQRRKLLNFRGKPRSNIYFKAAAGNQPVQL
jgi:hypothetical protein